MKKLYFFEKKQPSMKMMAVCLAVCVAWFQIAVIEVNAASAAQEFHEYKTAHGEDNDSEDLYIWRRCKIGSREIGEKPLNDYLSDKDPNHTFRLLLAYQYDNSSYYIESNWTKTRFTSNNSDAAGTALQAVCTTDNVQVRVGDDSFITRGALRSFFAKRTGWKDFSAMSNYTDTYTYTIYAPNEADNGIENINGGDVKLCHTYDNATSELGLWFYDGAGNPIGNSSSAKDWSNDAYKKSHFINNGKNEYYEEWALESGAAAADSYTYEFIVEDTTWADPMLAHSTDKNIYKKMGENMLTVNETSWTDARQDNLWIVYVGEKIGNITHIDKGNTRITVSDVFLINSPAYIKRDQTIVVEPGAMMFVNSVLELDGSIENHGTIIVGDKAFIAGNADISGGAASIINMGGDLVIYPDGVVSVAHYVSNNSGQTITRASEPKNNLMVTLGMTLYGDTVFDYKGSKNSGSEADAKKCLQRTIRGFSGVSKSGDKFVFNRGSANIESTSAKATFLEPRNDGRRPIYD